jgi:hypothetical protein
VVRWGAALLAAAALCAAVVARPAAQNAPTARGLHAPLDELLDTYVRDGLVYYAALRADRGRLDRYVAALDSPATQAAHAAWMPDERAAFWVNAYNAFVLRTVIDQYPIRGRAPEYPASSIRQIPGAFDGRMHRAAGRAVTLDAIEQTILPAFDDPRLYLALGRGATGSPRLRSEAYAGARLQAQLQSVEAECPTRAQCLAIDPAADVIHVTPVIGWHEQAFISRYAGAAAGFENRSPIERAVLGLIDPHLLTTERTFLARGRFRVVFGELDWRLNDLTGR